MTDFLPASSIDTEITLLGACCIEGISPPCQAECFYSSAHRLIALAMQGLEREGATIDLPMIYERLQSSGQLDLCGGPAYLAQLLDRVGDTRNLERYAEIVRQYHVLRMAQHAAHKFLDGAMQLNGTQPADKVSKFAAEVLQLTTSSDNGPSEIPLKECVKRALSRIEERMSGSDDLVGIPTGIRHLDRITGGMESGKLIVLAARPSMGKTALALNIARNASAISGARGMLFSLEMPASSLVNRLLAMESRIASDKIRTGRMMDAECAKVFAGAVHASSLDITIWDTPCTELEIMRRVRRINPHYVIIDYLQLVRPSNPTGKPNYDVGTICTAMKHLSQEMKIPVILLSQLNRDVEKDKRKPRLSDLRDSGQIEQDADWILFLHQKDGDHQKPDREVTLAKQRDGDCGFWTMQFLRDFQIFQSIGVE